MADTATSLAPAPRTTALTTADVEHFWREGYCLARGLADPATCEALVATYEARQDQRVVAGGGWTPTTFNYQQPEADRELHRLLVDPGVLGAAEAILGLSPRFLYGMVAVVPAGGGKGLAWHQDNMYSQVLGGALNVFIAVRDIAPEQCMLWVAPRSHLCGVLPNDRIDGHHQAKEEPANALRLPAMRQGDVCIFDRNLLHRSQRNETTITRYAYAAQYCSPLARLAATGEIPPWPLMSEVQRHF